MTTFATATHAGTVGHSPVDAVIIGAGLAGLTAAATLARAGARVLVCEQAAQAGGLFSSFWRDGFLFDGGIKAVENSAVMMPMLAQFGLLNRAALQPSPIALVTGNRHQPMRGWADVEAYWRTLGALFPTEQSGLQSVLRDGKAVFDLLDALLCFPIPYLAPPGAGSQAQAEWMRAHGRALLRLPRAAALLRRPLRPYLQEHLQHPGLINLLSHLFPEGTSAFFGLGYFRMFLDYHYPRGGIGTIPRVLAEAVREWGGEILLNTRVEQILLRRGQASGVRLSSGEEVAAGHVVAAGDLRHALTELLPQGTLPARFTRRLLQARVSHSVVNVFLGIDLPVERLGLNGCPHVFFSPDIDGIGDSDRRARPDYFRHVPLEISVPCLHQPDLAPPGKTGLIASAMTSWEYDGGWERTPVAYAALKERCTRDVLASLEQLIPGLTARIVFSATATPRTIARLTSNAEGAIMGWSYDRSRTLARGSFLQIRSSVQTPVPRLLVAGHWAFSPGGSPTAVLTGKLAAEAVLHQAGESG